MLLLTRSPKRRTAGFPHNNTSLLRGAPRLPYSPVFFSPVFLCSPSEANASIFSSVSLFLAEVTQVNSIAVSPIQATDISVS